jgi:hypothetical protein
LRGYGHAHPYPNTMGSAALSVWPVRIRRALPGGGRRVKLKGCPQESRSRAPSLGGDAKLPRPRRNPKEKCDPSPRGPRSGDGRSQTHRIRRPGTRAQPAPRAQCQGRLPAQDPGHRRHRARALGPDDSPGGPGPAAGTATQSRADSFPSIKPIVVGADVDRWGHNQSGRFRLGKSFE